ncbi:MAG: DegV family protein [Desulfobacterales bacterium]
MNPQLRAALTRGYERLAAWSDLLDQINVFPVADADTGRNLMISLAPLHRSEAPTATILRRLLVSATGNSGNISACFFAGFVAENPSKDLHRAIKIGRERAWQAISDPKPGTILTLFDTLQLTFEDAPAEPLAVMYPALIDRLEESVHATAEILPELKAAGVVDAGALGIFIFMEGFFNQLAGNENGFRPLTKTFRNKLNPALACETGDAAGYCVDTLVEIDESGDSSLKKLRPYGNSLIVQREPERLKIHLHTGQQDAVRKQLEEMGRVVRWSVTDLRQTPGSRSAPDEQPAIHIVTDAAGSITRQDAARLGMTLLDSYIVVGDQSLPETVVDPVEIYALMRKGVRVTTAQASVFERHQRFQGLISRYGTALYLCVGSVYTGNYRETAAWKENNDPDDRLTIIDTGLASGRLGIVALATSRHAGRVDRAAEVLRYAAAAVQKSAEYLFLDRLQYLVAGGRLSKAKGYLGDFFHLKPVISPTAAGAVKVGTARSQDEQLEFALEKLANDLKPDAGRLILLEYSDNRRWVEVTVLREIKNRYPSAEIVLQPLSLTAGVHMGPGTWGVAYMIDSEGER